MRNPTHERQLRAAQKALNEATSILSAAVLDVTMDFMKSPDSNHLFAAFKAARDGCRETQDLLFEKAKQATEGQAGD